MVVWMRGSARKTGPMRRYIWRERRLNAATCDLIVHRLGSARATLPWLPRLLSNLLLSIIVVVHRRPGVHKAKYSYTA